MNELVASLLRASQHRFIGRLVRDPEIRYFESGNCVANARILVNRPGAKRDDGQEPDGFKVEIWGEKAQAFADQARKGALIDVTGRIKTETWTDRTTGETRQALAISAEEWSLVNTGAPAPARQQAAPAAAAAPAQAAWTSTATDDFDEVPF